jgi:hypothetical protein
VDQVQVDVVQAQPFEGPLERSSGVGLTRVLNPELGRHEDLVARDAAAAHGATNGLLVLIGGGRVDEPVTHVERGRHGPLGVLRRDLEHAEAEDRHLDTVVQRDCGDLRLHDTQPTTPTEIEEVPVERGLAGPLWDVGQGRSVR